MISYILAVITGLAVIGVDQYTKYIVKSTMVLGSSDDFIKGIIDLTYIENTGSAWGMLSGYTWLLLSITFVVMLVLVALLLKFGGKNKLMFWSVILVMSGGLGNMYDRIFRNGKVIDFFHFEFIPDFPVFNVADCAIVVGAGMLVLYFILDMIKENRANKAAAKRKNDANS